jgi:murein DD-endopeptidase MepM/ murein hydrolase activator NlpD
MVRSMRRVALPAVICALTALLLTPAADARAGCAPRPAYERACTAIVHEGRAIGRLVAAGDAGALFARFAPAYAEELPEQEVRESLARVHEAGPVGPRRGESVLPLSRSTRYYAADHAHAGGVLAIEVLLDARDRITYIAFQRREPLPPDPGAGREVRLMLPVTGTWWVWWGGRGERRNYHAVHPDQRHAYDLARWRRDGTRRGRGIRNRDYLAFNRRVVAPADGTVVAALDGVRDNRPQVEIENPEAPAGNHVLIALGGDRYVLLGHLRRGSVRVEAGQRVRAGQPLGRVGNSGNSSEPHLHVHAQDTPTLGSGTGLPIAFGPLVVNGRRVPWAAPVQGQFIAHPD